ncbi:MAG: M20/M25/M40 family metallo-hydrolase, partial [Spirochaetales bacterium]|nr:M20/M25/M40 family metallo-hydrolase [Spirochaetales bacterium]
NILPDSAEAIVNIRIIPGETTESVIKRLKGIIKNKDIEINFLDKDYASDPVNESEINSHGYKTLKAAVEAVYPDALVAPFLVTAATDSRHFEQITDNIYRFSPMALTPKELKTIHGVNESISIENFGKMIHFFKIMMKMI